MSRSRHFPSKPAAAKPRRISTVLMSGVTSEVGLPVVRELWERGFGVFGFYGRSRKRARMLEVEAATRQAALRLVQVDYLSPARARTEIRKAVRTVPAEWRKIVSFVGLAGYPARGVWQQPFAKHGHRLLEDIYRVDTLSHVWFLQAAGAALKRNRGSVVLMSSAAALLGDELGVPFALAKAANVALVKSLARLMAPQVRVNGVAPGALRTSWLDELTGNQRRRAREGSLLHRFGEPDEVALGIVELAVGKNRFQTGQILVIDGGVKL